MVNKVPTDDEILSALLDGEATDFELRRVVSDVQKSEDLAEKWRRYALVQDIVHSREVRPSLALTSRVAEYIENNPHKRKIEFPWMFGLAKLAISASVALTIVYSLPYLSPIFDETRSVVSNPSFKVDNNIRSLEYLFNNEHEIDPAAKKRLDEYISRINFNEEATENALPLPIEALRDSPLYKLVNDKADFSSR